jgi:2-methylfumaryl-CoA hydratase
MFNSNKINAGRFFENFTLNEAIQHATPRTITAGDCSLYTGLYGSRNPLHCSEPFAQSLGYKTTPVDDLLAFHIAFGKTVPDISVNAVAIWAMLMCVFCSLFLSAIHYLPTAKSLV